MRVLLIAPYCDGTDVGESWSNCQWARGLASRHDVTLLTLRRHGAPTVASQVPGARVIEWTDCRWPNRFSRLASMLKPGYLPFFVRARSWIRAAIARGEHFDVAHQLSPLALRYPSPLLGLGLPYIIGPLAGSIDTPPSFRVECRSDPWYVRLRDLDQLRLRYDPLLQRTYRDAAVVIGVAPYVKELLRSIPIRRFCSMSETGVWQLPPAPTRTTSAARGFRLLFVGRLVRSKGARDAIRAVAELPDLPAISLDIVGDGPDKTACQAEIARLGLTGRVRLHGRLPRPECDRFYAVSDIFLFPSFREPSGNVVLEALSWGLPVITSTNGGPGYVVDSSCGATVACRSPLQYAHALATAIRAMLEMPHLRAVLSDGARKRAAQLGLWERKIDRLCDIYRSLK